MNKQVWESRLIDYMDGKADETERAAVEYELLQNEQVRTLYNQLIEVMTVMSRSGAYEPSDKLRANFEKTLESEIAKQTRPAKTVFFSPVTYRIAAGVALLMAGLAIGYKINQSNIQAQELEALHQQVEDNRKLMLAMLGNQQSASQRIEAVSVANRLPEADDAIVSILVKTMNEDGNTNVRLAALDALSKFLNEPLVRKELLQALPKQSDPVVQIALIQLLVQMKEKSVINQLEIITKDQSVMKAVKDEAYSGILKLS